MTLLSFSIEFAALLKQVSAVTSSGSLGQDGLAALAKAVEAVEKAASASSNSGERKCHMQFFTRLLFSKILSLVCSPPAAECELVVNYQF